MKTIHKPLILGAALALPLCLASCKPNGGTPPIGKKEMISLLVDVHVAEAVVARQNTIPPEILKRDLVYKSVLDKHGLTEAEFDTAVAWYARHTSELKLVYKAVVDTITKRRKDF